MKILVISLAGIGDALLATPLIHELRVNFPDATIDALVFWAGARDLLAGNPHLRQVHQCNSFEVGAPAFLKFIFGLRRQHYDVSINTHPQSKVAYRVVARIIGATQRLSHSYGNSTFLDPWLVTQSLPQDYAIHSADNNLKLLSLLGKSPRLVEHGFELFLTPLEIAAAAAIAQQNQLATRRVVGIHVGSGTTKNLRLKRWPVENYIALIKQLTATRPEVTVLLFGGPEEQAENARIATEAAHPNLIIPKTRSIREAAALMKHCEVFLSVDNAMMHFAAAMKVPKQVLIESMAFGPTLEPYGRPYRLVQNPAVHGRNLDYYRYDGKGIRGTDQELRRIMEAVKVKDVSAAITEALG
ncbi:MAG: glycosyltransferase family 9 protein [Verrucomicrobiia bacterium]